MKKRICAILCLLLFCLSAVPAMAAPEGPVITLQPQSPNYPHYSVAIYTVKAEGTNLRATWYMDWQGTTYTISNIGGAMQPWEAYAGEAYGARQLDANTFTFIFEGIERDLDGAYIWCVIEDGHYDVASQKARVFVGNPYTPPTIVDIPAQLTVEQGAEAEIRCVAQAPEGTQLSFLWYETDTGRLEDMRAVNRGTETSDYMFCDTSTPGTRNYLCQVQTSEGGLAYSSVVPVTVTEKSQVAVEPQIQTSTLPEAVAGTPYTAQIGCSDPNAEFLVYYNPGKANDFEKIGLTLSESGQISGTPTAAGSYSFCICAAGAGGEDYAVYTLTVAEAAAQPTIPEEETKPTVFDETQPTVPNEQTQPTIPDTAVTTPTSPTAAPTTDPEAPHDAGTGVQWWFLAIVGAAAAGAGIGVAVLLVKKKS